MVSKYLVCGAGRVGIELSCFLASFGYEITLIDLKFEPRTYEIIREYKDKIRIVTGDASSEEVLEKGGIGTAICFFSTIGNYTANVRTILAARRWREVKEKHQDLKIIARASNEQEAALLHDLADHILFPEEEGSWEIAAIVRTMKEKHLTQIAFQYDLSSSALIKVLQLLDKDYIAVYFERITRTRDGRGNYIAHVKGWTEGETKSLNKITGVEELAITSGAPIPTPQDAQIEVI